MAQNNRLLEWNVKHLNGDSETYLLVKVEYVSIVVVPTQCFFFFFFTQNNIYFNQYQHVMEESLKKVDLCLEQKDLDMQKKMVSALH